MADSTHKPSHPPHHEKGHLQNGTSKPSWTDTRHTDEERLFGKRERSPSRDASQEMLFKRHDYSHSHRHHDSHTASSHSRSYDHRHARERPQVRYDDYEPRRSHNDLMDRGRRDSLSKSRDTSRPPSEGNAATVASHYNEQKSIGVEHREFSQIVGVRKFNNWVKSTMIQKSCDFITSLKLHDRPSPHPDLPTGLRVLDLCCGKGGDIRKWFFTWMRHYVAVDIASESVAEAAQRFESLMKTRRTSTTSCFKVSNVFEEDLETVFGNKYLESFHIVSCMFAFHYAFENERMAETAFRNVSKMLTLGGYFIFTIPSHDLLLDMKAKQLTGNALYQIKFVDRPKQDLPQIDQLSLNQEHKLDNLKYIFSLKEAVNECPEFSVPLPYLKYLAEKYGFELSYKRSFSEFYYDFKDTKTGSDLLQRLKVISPYRPQPALDMTLEELEAVHIYDAIVLQKTKLFSKSK